MKNTRSAELEFKAYENNFLLLPYIYAVYLISEVYCYNRAMLQIYKCINTI